MQAAPVLYPTRIRRVRFEFILHPKPGQDKPIVSGIILKIFSRFRDATILVDRGLRGDAVAAEEITEIGGLNRRLREERECFQGRMNELGALCSTSGAYLLR